MSEVHFLNVGDGDCTVIRHNSGRTSMFDISKGNYQSQKTASAERITTAIDEARGNFRMSKRPTNPVTYLSNLGISSLFRFVLTHPDMDHLDGFDALFQSVKVTNFWHTGVKRNAPEFGEGSRYNSDDWDRYEYVKGEQQAGVTVLSHLAGSKFRFANQGADGARGGDGLQILSPDAPRVKAASIAALTRNEDVNDASYVILYRTSGGQKILIPGDSHDESWDFVIENYEDAIADCDVLFAPHHGRKSGRSFEFLDYVRPKITLFGCASDSNHLAYNAWSSRDLHVITNNQAGNIIMECLDDRIDFFVENRQFARARRDEGETEVSKFGGYFIGFLKSAGN